jgi:hypothetical protein
MVGISIPHRLLTNALDVTPVVHALAADQSRGSCQVGHTNFRCRAAGTQRKSLFRTNASKTVVGKDSQTALVTSRTPAAVLEGEIPAWRSLVRHILLFGAKAWSGHARWAKSSRLHGMWRTMGLIKKWDRLRAMAKEGLVGQCGSTGACAWSLTVIMVATVTDIGTWFATRRAIKINRRM